MAATFEDYADRRELVNIAVACHRLRKREPGAADILRGLVQIKNGWMNVPTDAPVTQQRLNAEYSMLTEYAEETKFPVGSRSMELALRFMLFDVYGGTYARRLQPLLRNPHGITGGGDRERVQSWMMLAQRLPDSKVLPKLPEYTPPEVRAHVYRLG